MKAAHQIIAEGILFTDQYQLTMAQLYYRMGLPEVTVQFDHYFREYPNYGLHQAGYCINAGLEWLLEWMQHASFNREHIELLRGQLGRGGQRIFAEDFLKWLKANGNFDGISIRAVPEGRVIHPNTPITVVQGPLAMAQILETALLNKLNYQILIATKAARLREIGRGQILLEFGLRRAHDMGANAGTRAALIGGANYSSNVGMSQLLGLQPKGTHAHSMVQLFLALGMEEIDAFQAYAELYPEDCLLLVDTIDTLGSGIPNAIKVFEGLRKRGYAPVGIRLDSGDLATLSIKAARMLDEAGFPNTSITLSNDLDELIISQILNQVEAEASRYGVDPNRLIARLAFGVGTRLITSHGDPALGGIYKLAAVRKDGSWRPAMKVSDTMSKTSNPGRKLLWRIYDRGGKANADLVSLESEDLHQYNQLKLHHLSDPTKSRIITKDEISRIEFLLIDAMNEGKIICELPDIEELRLRRQADVECLNPDVRRIVNPKIYDVSITQDLWTLKNNLIQTASSNSIL